MGEFVRCFLGECSCLEVDSVPVTDAQIVGGDVELAGEDSDVTDDTWDTLTAVVEVILPLASVVRARDCSSDDCFAGDAVHYFSFGVVDEWIAKGSIPVQFLSQ